MDEREKASPYVRYVSPCYNVRMSQPGVAHAFWDRIRHEINTQGLTQKELVARSGIPASTINNLRDSTRPPQPRIVHAIADALGIDRDEATRLAGRADPQPAQALVDDFDDLDLEIEMIRKSDLPRAIKESMIAEAMRLRDKQAAERREFREKQASDRRTQIETWIEIARRAQPAT